MSETTNFIALNATLASMVIYKEEMLFAANAKMDVILAVLHMPKVYSNAQKYISANAYQQ
jgi:hypothetical protein